VEAPSTRNQFGGTFSFKVHIVDIPFFEGKIHIDSLEKWLSLLEHYNYVEIFSNSEKITFALLNSLPHVKDWWDTYYVQHVEDYFEIIGIEPTWLGFVDTLKEFYQVGNYNNQCTRWTNFLHEKTQVVLEYTNTFHTFYSKMGIKDSKWHLV